MAWIGKREQVIVGFLFVLLLAVATAGRLAAAGDRFVWLAGPAVGMVSVDEAMQAEGPPQPTVNQVQAAMQQRIRGYELATIQTDLELAGLQRQIATLRGQVSEGAAKLLATEQDLEFVQDQLINEQSMRENQSRELAQAHRRIQALTDLLRQTESQVVLLKAQLAQPAPTQPPLVQAESGSVVRP